MATLEMWVWILSTVAIVALFGCGVLAVLKQNVEYELTCKRDELDAMRKSRDFNSACCDQMERQIVQMKSALEVAAKSQKPAAKPRKRKAAK